VGIEEGNRMNLQLFLQLLLNGLVIGSTYVLVATGFTVVYGTARVLNFAHGHYYMLGAFIYGGLALLGLHWALSLILTALALGLFGLITWHLIFKPLYFDVFLTVAASIGMGLIMVQGIIVTAGERDIIVPSVFQGSFDVGDVTISIEKLAIVGISFGVMLGLHLFLKTRIGKALEATTIDQDAASLQGINPGRMFAIAMVLGSTMAGIAGAVIVPYLTAQANMGYPITLMFLCIVVVAGHGSVKGAVIVGILFGLIKSFGYHFLGTMDIIVLMVVVAILMYVKPWGIWGVEFKRTI
jgi:branched-chain amino acid transport system permease protein